MDNYTAAECGLLTGNERATPSATPKIDEDVLLQCPPRHLSDERPTHKRIVKGHRLQGCNGPRKMQNTGTAAIAIAGLDPVNADHTPSAN